MTRWLLGLGFAAAVALGAAGCDEEARAVGCEAVPAEEAERRPLEGFGEVTFVITGPAGEETHGCALLADTPETRSLGLMHQDDLRGYDAMVFRFDGPFPGAFYMFNTRIPLSIAYFAEDGTLVSTHDMEPCTSDDPAACERYSPAGDYVHAIEVAQGDLGRLGIVEGAVLSFPPAAGAGSG